MSIHSFAIKRARNAGAAARPTSAALFSQPREQRRRVLIRRPWVRAVVDPVAFDRKPPRVVIARGGFVARDRRAA